MSINFTINAFDTYKTNYNSENLNERDEMFFDPDQFKMIEKILRAMQKPI